jgi:hypothetical protein
VSSPGFATGVLVSAQGCHRGHGPVNRAGRELINTGVAATNNFVACVTLINKELKNRNPKPRTEWSTEQFEAATAGLEDILNVLTRRYKGLLSGKTKG